MEEVVPFTVCVRYHDYLKESLRRNRAMFREYHVITTPEDTLTQEVCAEYGVQVHFFTDLHLHRASFNKSGMVHQMQAYLHDKYPEKWILILDADICLPTEFVELVQNRLPIMDHSALYSLPRVDFRTLADYQAQTNGIPYPGKFMGFFQLYYDKTQKYMKHSNSCRCCDHVFAKQFKKKYLLSEEERFWVQHLGQDNVNHHGRTSGPWDPEPT